MQHTKSIQLVALFTLSIASSLALLTFVFFGQSIVSSDFREYLIWTIRPMTFLLFVTLLNRVFTDLNFRVWQTIYDGLVIIIVPLAIVHLGAFVAHSLGIVLVPFEVIDGLTPFTMFLSLVLQCCVWGAVLGIILHSVQILVALIYGC